MIFTIVLIFVGAAIAAFGWKNASARRIGIVIALFGVIALVTVYGSDPSIPNPYAAQEPLIK